MIPTEHSNTNGGTSAAPLPFPFEAIHEINERVLEHLAQMARGDSHDSAGFPSSLRQQLRETSPVDRKRAATRAYLLVDFQFSNVEWWEAVVRFSTKPSRASAMGNAFPRRTAVPLTRATLVAARELIRADCEIACIVLAAAPRVAECVSRLTSTDIDRIADHRFQYLEPRWLHQPDIWHSLLRFPGPEGSPSARCDCVQILIGALLLNQHIRT
jgi:hypothetical protein